LAGLESSASEIARSAYQSPVVWVKARGEGEEEGEAASREVEAEVWWWREG